MSKPKIRTRLPRKEGSHVISFRVTDSTFRKAVDRTAKNASVHTFARSVFEAVLHA